MSPERGDTVRKPPLVPNLCLVAGLVLLLVGVSDFRIGSPAMIAAGLFLMFIGAAELLNGRKGK